MLIYICVCVCVCVCVFCTCSVRVHSCCWNAGVNGVETAYIATAVYGLTARGKQSQIGSCKILSPKLNLISVNL